MVRLKSLLNQETDMFAIIEKTSSGDYSLHLDKAFKYVNSALKALHEATAYSARPSLRSAVQEDRIYIADLNCKSVLISIENSPYSKAEALRRMVESQAMFDPVLSRDIVRCCHPLAGWVTIPHPTLTGTILDSIKSARLKLLLTQGQPQPIVDKPTVSVEEDLDGGMADVEVHRTAGSAPQPESEPEPMAAPDPNDPMAGLTSLIQGVVKQAMAKSGVDPTVIRQRVEQAAQQAVNAARKSSEDAQAKVAEVLKGAEAARREFRDKLSEMKPIVKQHVVKIGDCEPIVFAEGRPIHKAFDRVIATIQALRQNGMADKCNILLVGPAGTGKTTLASMIAESLGLSFYALNMSEGIDEGHLTERFCPDENTGGWKRTVQKFAQMIESGGVILMDEMDGADRNVLVSLHSVLDNGFLPMPNDPVNSQIDRHEDCIIIATMNTFGTGSDRLYTGRQQLDAATRNRFGQRTFWVGYDDDLESMLTRDANLKKRMLDVRERVAKNSLEQIVSTRDLLIADVLVAAKVMDHDEALNRLTLGWTADERVQVGLTNNNPLLSVD